jgi:hypothetical protein
VFAKPVADLGRGLERHAETEADIVCVEYEF